MKIIFIEGFFIKINIVKIKFLNFILKISNIIIDLLTFSTICGKSSYK